jgi:hypothetical protein
MSGDPLGPVVQAFEGAAADLRRTGERTRESWNDEARRRHDHEFADPVGAETRAALQALERVRQELRRALSEM